MTRLRQGFGAQARLLRDFGGLARLCRRPGAHARLCQRLGADVRPRHVVATRLPGILVVSALAMSLAMPAGVRAQARQPSSPGGSAAVAAPSAAVPEGLTVTAGVDRPAMWVADRLTYTVEIVCPRGVDILVGDLGRDKLKLTGLDVLSADSRRREDGDVTRYAFDYVLTTYRVDVATPLIGSFPVRYYLTRPGQRPEEAAPAGSVVVPPVAVAFRSLLPDDQAIYDVRDGQSVPPRWLPYRLLGVVGIGLILLSATPAAFLLIRFAQAARERRRTAARRPSSRKERQTARAALDDVRATNAGDADARRAGFARLDALIRQHLSDVCGVAASAMTPEEIEIALEPCATRVPVEIVGSILASCELARYGSPDLQPSLDTWHQAVGQADQVLSAGR